MLVKLKRCFWKDASPIPRLVLESMVVEVELGWLLRVYMLRIPTTTKLLVGAWVDASL
jgi:hypothetical protein